MGDVQKKYTFFRECIKKYPQVGNDLFELFQQIYGRMPVVAVLHDAIFCAHGGIPHLSPTLEHIRKMPDYIGGERDSELFWEIVWSDPVADSQYLAVCNLFGQDPKEQAGFVRNTKRGAAWFFAQEAAEKYLAANGLTHIIRAHEVPLNGFTFHFGERCATVFSCSHYQSGNKCAVLFVDQERIRVLRIDTQHNGAPFSNP